MTWLNQGISAIQFYIDFWAYTVVNGDSVNFHVQVIEIGLL